MESTDKLLGLYLHIPFCRQKCVYCDFYSLAGNEGRMDAYTDALCAHLQEKASLAAGYTVDTVYFGGGTPSYLGERRLSRILGMVLRNYTVSGDVEITLEANPDSATDLAALETLRKAGFNRLSLGMQSACDAELKEIGRAHTVEQLKNAVEMARKAGFDNLSLDLMYGLPHQTMERWATNLAAAVALSPEHLSCYGLKVEEGTPLFVRRNTAELPDDEAQAEMYLYTVDYLRRAGCVQYEISNFAQPGRESRHNLKYWTLGEYMGFGPGAHSDFGNVRYAYEKNLESYIRGVRDNAVPLVESQPIAPLDRDTEWIMLGLRMVRGLNPTDFERRFCRQFNLFLPFLEQCEKAGYAVRDEERWHLTPKGFLVSNQIIRGLLEVLEANKHCPTENA